MGTVSGGGLGGGGSSLTSGRGGSTSTGAGSGGTGGSGLRALAALVYNQITEERRIDEKMKEEQKRADSLQQKLDALKEVEKSLLDREQSKVRPK